MKIFLNLNVKINLCDYNFDDVSKKIWTGLLRSEEYEGRAETFVHYFLYVNTRYFRLLLFFLCKRKKKCNI